MLNVANNIKTTIDTESIFFNILMAKIKEFHLQFYHETLLNITNFQKSKYLYIIYSIQFILKMLEHDK
jgi:hypothetical protein